LNGTNDPSASEQSRVWIVNADHWPRAYLRAELIERGYDATGFESMKDAVIRLLVARARRPALLVIDLHGQVIDDKVVSVLLRERLPVVAVIDATSPERAPPGVVVDLLRRPLTIGDVAGAVDRFMGRGAPGARADTPDTP
jgi:DNA-binding response OmpR family regulator